MLIDAFGRVREVVGQVVGGLTGAELTFRPGPDANSIAWLVWHLTRIEDDHISDLLGTEQVWTADGWIERFQLPFDASATGYGFSSDDVAAVRVESPDLLVGYQEATYALVVRYLQTIDDAELDRIVDTRWDPPVTAAVRIVSVMDDAMQHAGQAAYVRGLLSRADPEVTSGVLSGARILVTGPTGQVALPVTRALAADNEVIGIARFRDAAARQTLEDAGVTCIEANLADGDFAAVPADVDYVLNLAVVKSNRWDLDLRANAEATGLLMAHCRNAKAWLHCSSTGVYQPAGSHPLAETDPLGDNHRVIMETYSIAKIATEAVARLGARQWDMPVTIARLNVPYGDNGGWPAFHLSMIEAGQPVPLHPDRPNLFNPIHEDDIIRMIPRLLEIASVPATIVNWGGSEAASIEDWSAVLGEAVGRDVSFVETEQTIGSVVIDPTKMHELVGRTEVNWRDGMRRMACLLSSPSADR